MDFLLVYEKARELGYALLDCDETVILKAAEANLDNDQEAQGLIRQFREYQRKIQELQEAGEDVADEEWEEFQEIQEKMKANKTIQAYFAAQARFGQVLQRINAIIHQIVFGGPCGPASCAECEGECG